MQLLTDLVPRGTHVLVCDPERVRTRAADLVRTAEEFLAASWATAAEAGQAPIDLGASSFRDLAEVGDRRPRSAACPGGRRVPSRWPAEDDDEHVTLDATVVERFSGDVPRAIEQVRSWSREGWRVVRHLRRARAPRSAPPTSSPRPTSASGWCPTSPRRPTPGSTLRHPGQPGGRVRLPRRRAGAAHRARPDRPARHARCATRPKMPARRRNAVDLVQLQPGDLVVHEQHGIGRYIEMISRTVNGGQRDYLIVEYAPSRRNQPPDRLFVPTDSLDQLTRYVGGEAPGAVQARRRRLAEDQEQGPQGGQADRRRADPAVLGADGDQGPRLRPGHRLAARARGRLPVPGDARPAGARSTRSRPT